MTTVFVLLENHFFETPDKRIWCDRVISYDFLQRYLQSFDKVIVCGRLKNITENEIGAKNLVSGKGVSFVGLPDFVGALGTLKNLFKIRKIIKDGLKKADRAIVRAPSPLSLVAYPVIKKSSTPFAVEFVMAADKMFDSDKLPYKIMNKILARRAKKMCLVANGVSYVTEYTLQKEYPSKKTAFTANYSSVDLKPDFFYEQNWKSKNPPKCFNIVHIGYMDSNRKGQDILIDAVNEIVNAGQTNIHVRLIGDGKMRSALEKKVVDLGLEEYVEFTGAIGDKNKIRGILIKSHLFVFPSRSEGLPRAVIEAMAVGLVCITSPTDGTPEIIDEEFLVKQYNGADYAKKIITIINDWSGMIMESRKNSERAKDFEKSILDKRRKGFYDRLLKDPKKINVLNVVNSMNVGGAETMLMNVLRTIDRDRFRIFFLCYSDQEYDYEAEVNKLGGTILRMHRKNPVRDIKAIKRIIKENNIDVVHSHTYHNSAVVAIAAKRSAAEILMLTHSHTTKSKPANSLVRKIYYALSVFIINRYSDFLVACGKKASEGIFRNMSKIRRINNGIIVEEFRFSNVDRKKIRKELGINSNTKVIGHIGRFTEVKNHEFILKVFYDYSRKNPDSTLLLIGDGDLLPKIKQKVKSLKLEDKVKFLGLRNDTNKLYSVMDVLIFPSLYEGLPLTLIEAQANGLPIVASDRIDRAVDLTGHVAFLPLEKDSDYWVSVLNDLIDSRYNNLESISKNGYDMSVEVKKLEQLYSEGVKKCR